MQQDLINDAGCLADAEKRAFEAQLILRETSGRPMPRWLFVILLVASLIFGIFSYVVLRDFDSNHILYPFGFLVGSLTIFTYVEVSRIGRRLEALQELQALNTARPCPDESGGTAARSASAPHQS